MKNMRLLGFISFLSVAVSAFAQVMDPPSDEGEALYEQHCASCHAGTQTGGGERAPSRAAVSGMSARAILSALEGGRMAEQGAALTSEQRRQVAEWWAGAPVEEVSFPDSAYCAKDPTPADDATIAWSGWGGDLPATGYRTAEQAGLTADEVPGLELKWAFGFPGAIQSRSKPAVVGAVLIVGSPTGEVYALDAASGCIHWIFHARGAVRGAIVVARAPTGRLAAYFADFRTDVYAIDVQDGDLVWRNRAGSHPDASNTGSVAYHDGRLFVPLSSMEGLAARDPNYECCVTSGEVVAMDAANGEILWRHRVVEEPPGHVGENARGTRQFGPSGAPVWASPTVDVKRDLVYVGTGENYSRPGSDSSDAVLALDADTGEVAWRFQGTAGDTWNLACGYETPDNCPSPMGPDVDFGMAPVRVTLGDGREILVAGQKSGVLWGLDPDREGTRLWSVKLGRGSSLGGVHWGLATDGRFAYVPISDTQFGMMGVEPDFPASPGLYAVDLNTGGVAWKAPAPTDTCQRRENCWAAYSAAPTAIEGAVFVGGLDGHLRAYSSRDGELIWDFDTVRAYETVNGVAARGGAIDGPGPVVTGGMVYSHSGYGWFAQMPGNVLLAFGKKGE